MNRAAVRRFFRRAERKFRSHRGSSCLVPSLPPSSLPPSALKYPTFHFILYPDPRRWYGIHARQDSGSRPLLKIHRRTGGKERGKKINGRFEWRIISEIKKRKGKGVDSSAREVSNRIPAVHLNMPTESSSYSNRAGGDDATSKGNTGFKEET